MAVCLLLAGCSGSGDEAVDTARDGATNGEDALGGSVDGGVDAGTRDDASAPECTSTADCTAAVDACHTRACNDGVCSYPAAADGTSCSDGDPCNGAESCTAGTCTAGAPLDCDDDDPCTADSCGPSGCAHAVQADGPPQGGDASCVTGELGACSEGALQCVGGTLECVRLNAPAPDVTCNAVDEDCNGVVDDGYVRDTSCFSRGVCAAGNVASSCNMGVITPCQTGAPTGVSEAICTGDDDDCDGATDEDAAVGTCLKTVNTIVVYDAAYATLAEKPTKAIAAAFDSAMARYASAGFVPPIAIHLGAQMSWERAVPQGMTYPPTSDPLDGQALLAAFTAWVTQHRSALDALAGSPADHVILLTGRSLSGSGELAAVGAMCTSSSTSVVSMRPSWKTYDLGSAIAHVLGLSLGMPALPQGSSSVMSTTRGKPVGFLSTDATAAGAWFTGTYAAKGFPHCLDDRPMTQWLEARCGDGRIEGAEDCDPGLGGSDACCTPSCRLAPGCACANTQPCCVNGNLAGAGTICRLSAHATCDVAEACSGTSADCPPNVHSPVGTPCTDAGLTASYCFRGRCSASRTTLCRDLDSPSVTGCSSSTECGRLACSRTAVCDIWWIGVEPTDGTPCGGADPTAAFCVDGACVPVESAATSMYLWKRGPWSACIGGTQTRTVDCTDYPGLDVVAPSLCDLPVPASSRSCP